MTSYGSTGYSHITVGQNGGNKITLGAYANARPQQEPTNWLYAGVVLTADEARAYAKDLTETADALDARMGVERR